MTTADHTTSNPLLAAQNAMSERDERIKALEEALRTMLDAFYEDPFEADTGTAVEKAYAALGEPA
jgi:hypothetical protein